MSSKTVPSVLFMNIPTQETIVVCVVYLIEFGEAGPFVINGEDESLLFVGIQRLPPR